MGLMKRNGKSKSGWEGITKAIDKIADSNKQADEVDAGPPTQARSAEDFGAVDVADFEEFEGSNLAALRNAYSNQPRADIPGSGAEDAEEDGGEADVRIGEDGEADLSGSRKRRRSPTGAAGTSSLSPSIRI